MTPRVSVVIPAHDAARTLGRVLDAVERELPDAERIVVDDRSSDGTPGIAERHGARVLHVTGGRAGGARNVGWDASTGEVVVFLDADDVPCPGWGEGLRRALAEFPGAVIGCARVFSGHTAWEWVGHLQIDTPRLPRGGPRPVGFLASFCLAVPRDAPLRWDESFGGEDNVFCIDARAAGLSLVFDPRFATLHDPGRDSFAAVRAQQRRLAYELARAGPAELEGVGKRIFSRVPVHYFLLARLPLMYGRVRSDDALRRTFVRVLPRLVLAEWLLGLSALRYVRRRPPLRTGTDGA